MKKHFLLFTALVFGIVGYSQELQYELSFNNGIQNEISNVSSGSTYFYGLLHENGSHDNLGTYFIRLDTNMTIPIVKTQIDPTPNSYSVITDMTQGYGFYITSHAMSGCDVLEGCSASLQRVSYSGIQDWIITYPDSLCENYQFGGTISNDLNSIYTNYYNENNSFLLHFDINGYMLDSVRLNDTLVGLTTIQENRESDVVVAKGNVVYLINRLTGAIEHFNALNGEIKHFAKNYNSDRLFVVTTNELYEVSDTSLTILNTANLGYDNYSVSNEDRLYSSDIIISKQADRLIQLKLDLNLQVLDSLVIPIDASMTDYLALNGLGRTYVIAKHQLSEYYSARLLSYNQSDNRPETLTRTDAGIVNVRIKEKKIKEEQAGSHIYDLKLNVDVLVKNFGTNELNSVRITHIQGGGICEVGYYQNLFDSLNIMPGDSLWINLGWAGGDYNYFGNDSVRYNFCAFTSDVNKLADLNVDNDDVCKEFVYVTTEIAENASKKTVFNVYPNPATNTLNFEGVNLSDVEIYNVEGRLVKQVVKPKQAVRITELLPGYYYIKATTNNGELRMSKFIKQQ